MRQVAPVIIPPIPAPAPVSARDTTVGAFQQEQPRRSGKLGLVLLLLAALLIGASAAAGFFVYTSSHSAANAPTLTPARPTPKPTHHPKATPTLQPTLGSTPTTVTTVPPTFPAVAGVHHGTVHNTTGGLTAAMSLSIQQSGGTISGNFTVDSPLQGSGPLTGNVTTTDGIQFVVNSNQVPAPLYFWGIVQADGSMQGNYCSLDSTNQCNPTAGGAGNWNAGPATTSMNFRWPIMQVKLDFRRDLPRNGVTEETESEFYSPPSPLIATCSNECSKADDFERKLTMGSAQSTRSEA